MSLCKIQICADSMVRDDSFGNEPLGDSTEWIRPKGGGGGGGGGKGGSGSPDFSPGGRTYVFAPLFLRPPIKLESSSVGVADVAKATGPRAIKGPARWQCKSPRAGLALPVQCHQSLGVCPSFPPPCLSLAWLVDTDKWRRQQAPFAIALTTVTSLLGNGVYSVQCLLVISPVTEYCHLAIGH